MKLIKAGESHGEAIVGIIENVPFGLEINEGEINCLLAERSGAYGRGSRQKNENNRARFIAGLSNGRTTGGNLAFLVENGVKNYYELNENGEKIFREANGGEKVTAVRPGHADLAGLYRFCADDCRVVSEGASARSTCADVVAGGAALQFLSALNIKIAACVSGLPGYLLNAAPRYENISLVKPPYYVFSGDENKAKSLVDEAASVGDTLGGTVTLAVKGVKAGFGCYVSEKRVDGLIAALLMKIPSVKGVYFGKNPFENLKGSEYISRIKKDEETGNFFSENNECGGVTGGMTDGNEIIITVAVKPVPTLPMGVKTVDFSSGKTVTAARPRGDVTSVFACVPILKSALALGLTEIICERIGCDSMRNIIARNEVLK